VGAVNFTRVAVHWHFLIVYLSKGDFDPQYKPLGEVLTRYGESMREFSNDFTKYGSVRALPFTFFVPDKEQLVMPGRKGRELWFNGHGSTIIKSSPVRPNLNSNLTNPQSGTLTAASLSTKAIHGV